MNDQLPQRVLLYELKRAIDRARHSPQPRWVEAVDALVEENPNGMKSKHITHNLGAARLEWLRAHARSMRPSDSDSLAP